jgi:hypothetical protein
MEDHYKGKIREWDKRIAESPYDGQLRFKRGDSKTSLDAFYESQKKTEEKHTADILQIHDEIRRKQVQLAHSSLDDFTSALDLNFTDGQVYFQRATVRLSSVLKIPDDVAANNERFEEAKRDLVKALANGVPEQDILEFRGDAKRKLGDFEGALSDYRKINLAKQDADLEAMWYARMARTQFKLKQYGEAIAFAKQALVLCGKIPHEFAYMRGRIKQSSWQTSAESHFGLEQWDEALIALDKYLAIRPDKLRVRMLRATTNIMLKKYQEAVEDCDKIIYEDGDNIEARTLRDVAVRLRGSTLQGPPPGMSRGEVPEPFNPGCNAAQVGFAGFPLVGTVFSQRNGEVVRPSAPPPEDNVQNEKVLKRQGSCRIL